MRPISIVSPRAKLRRVAPRRSRKAATSRLDFCPHYEPHEMKRSLRWQADRDGGDPCDDVQSRTDRPGGGAGHGRPGRDQPRADGPLDGRSVDPRGRAPGGDRRPPRARCMARALPVSRSTSRPSHRMHRFLPASGRRFWSTSAISILRPSASARCRKPAAATRWRTSRRRSPAAWPARRTQCASPLSTSRPCAWHIQATRTRSSSRRRCWA